MCFTPRDNTAQIMRQQETERQQNITRGTGKINAAFQGFGPEFYNQREADYKDFYMPQVEKQGRDASDALTYNLARSGNLDSSTGAKQSANLTGKINDARGSVAEGAFGASAAARGDVESNRSDLIRMLEGGGNIANAANTAQARALQLSKPQPYSPLTDLFSNFTGQLSNSVALQGAGYPGWSITRPRTAAPGGSVSHVGG